MHSTYLHISKNVPVSLGDLRRLYTLSVQLGKISRTSMCRPWMNTIISLNSQLMKRSKSTFFVSYEYKPNHYIHYETRSYPSAEKRVEKLRAFASSLSHPCSRHILFVRFNSPSNFFVDFLPIK